MKFQALRDLISAAGGRKFLVTVLFGIGNALLLMHGDISREIYRDLFLGSVAAFIAGNVMQKRAKTNAEQSDS